MSDTASATPTGTDSGTDARATTASEGDGDPDLPGLRRRRARDESELFESFNHKLVGIIASRVHTSRANVDDACGFAWMQFVRYQPDHDGAWRSWLITTAEREAWKLQREQNSAVRFIPEAEYRVRGGARETEWPWHDDSRRTEALEALEALSKVPDRRRRALELHVSGLSYDEIAGALGISRTRVNHLITEANAAIRQGREQVNGTRAPQSGRACGSRNSRAIRRPG